MNSLDPKIQFTIERSDESLSETITFLDMSLSLAEGKIMRNWYRKEVTKPIFLHAKSHHPEHMKVNAITNQYGIIDQICNSAEAYSTAINKMDSIFLQNPLHYLLSNQEDMNWFPSLPV